MSCGSCVPAALPYIFSAFKVAATASVVGAIIGELPSSIQSGLGGAIINFNQYYALEPENLWAVEPRRRAPRHLVLPRRRARREARRPPAAGAAGVSDADAVVSARGISKTFGKGGVTALEDIDLEVGQGEFISLIGPSGCGKSTLLRVIGDLVEPSTGEILVNGKTAHRARPRPRLRHRLPGRRALRLAHGHQEHRAPLELMGCDRATRAERVVEMMHLVELEGFEKHYPWQLSGGMQQRVSIARALSFSPALLLMDEPFGALDEMTRERLNLELLRIWSETGSTVIFVTHSISEAVYLSTRVVVMSPRPGRITSVVPIDLPQPRTFETREDPRFFELVTEVREALHAGGADAVEPNRGARLIAQPSVQAHGEHCVSGGPAVVVFGLGPRRVAVAAPGARGRALSAAAALGRPAGVLGQPRAAPQEADGSPSRRRSAASCSAARSRSCSRSCSHAGDRSGTR